MKRVVILMSQDGDWEALYIDGKEVNQGHVLGEGDSKLYLLRMAKQYDFTIDDVCLKEVIDEDEDMLAMQGSFPTKLSSLKGKYEE